jgi:carbohydrate-selective porin OprB
MIELFEEKTMRLFKFQILIAVAVSVYFVHAAPNIETIKAVIKVQSKLDTIEQKVARSDSTLLMLEARIAEEEYKIQQIEQRDYPCADTTDRLHRQYGVPAIAQEDFTIGVGATMVLQATNHPNAVSNNKRVGDATYSANVTFEKKFDSAASRAFLRCEAAGGNGLDEDVRVVTGVNYDALGTQGVRVAEAWYEQSFFAGKILGTIGLMDPSAYFDVNDIANDETVQFLSHLFIVNPAIEYPVASSGVFYAPGVLFQLDFVQWLQITGGIFDANRDWLRIGDNLSGMGQIAIAPSILGSQGNYRFYSWYNQMPHRNWNDTSVSNALSYGFGLSFDQRFGEALTLFLRYGTRNTETYDSAALSDAGPFASILANSWSSGVEICGKLWHRDNDALGIAAGQTPFSDEFKRANPDRQAKTETHFELYYKFQCFSKMSISPDFQYILNPFGKDGTYSAENIPVFGIRSEVDF